MAPITSSYPRTPLRCNRVLCARAGCQRRRRAESQHQVESRWQPPATLGGPWQVISLATSCHAAAQSANTDPVQGRRFRAMVDLILPIVVGVVAVVIAMGVQRAWELQREGLGRPNPRIAGLVSRWADKVRAIRMRRGETPATPTKTAPPLADPGPPLPWRDARRVQEAHSAANPPGRRPDRPSGELGPPPSGQATAAAAGASLTGRHSVNEPSSDVRKPPKAAGQPRGRSTIAVDPLDVPLDPRHARVAAGALIDDLEVGKIGHPR